MKAILPIALSTFLLLAGCGKEEVTPSGNTCADERTLEVYQDVDAVVVTASGVLCFVVDKDDIAQSSYRAEHFLVPVPAISFQGHTWGERAVISGRKKSCYGLVNFQNATGVFGHKLEVSSIKYSK